MPFQKILALFIIGHISVTTPLIEKCKKFNVALIVIKPNLRPVFYWADSAEANFLLRQKQHQLSKFDLHIAKALLYNKIQNQIDALENNPKVVGCGTPIMMMHEESSKDYIYGDFFSDITIIPAKLYWANMWLHADTFIYRNIDFRDKELNPFTFDDNILTCHFLKYGDILFLPTPTVAYRQLGDSSWGGRSESEKMLINVLQYVEGINILKWPLVCFIRNFGELRTLYDKRDESVDLKDFNEQLKCVLLNNTFVRRMVRYASQSKLYQLMYDVRYFLPLHSTRVVLKLKKFYMKKGKATQL